jgi:hypothetical protein
METNTRTKPNTKAQLKTVASLERRGYDHGFTHKDGDPVLVLRDKNIWVQVYRNGGYGPTLKASNTQRY